MAQFLVRRVGEVLWVGERPLMPEETRESLEEHLLLIGSTFRDLGFEGADVRAEFEARFGAI
jgi:hypothetical protein